MPNFPWRPGGVIPPAGDGALDELLATGLPPPDAAAGLEPVAELFAALRAGPSGRELAGQSVALAAFREAARRSRPPRRLRVRAVRARTVGARAVRARTVGAGRVRPGVRPGVRRAWLSSRLAAAAAVLVASGAAAAYVGVLPASLQRVAHEAIAAPAAKPAATAAVRSGAGVGLSAASSADSLCTAYRRASEHGGPADRAVAFRNLAQAAHGAGHVTSFCAALSHPGAADSKPGAAATPLRPQQPSPPAGQPRDDPTPQRPGHPAGRHHDHHGGDQSGHQSGQQPGNQTGPQPGQQTGHRPGHQPGDQSARPPGQQSVHPHHFLHREAVRGSPPGTRRPSHLHPSALSGQSRGC